MCFEHPRLDEIANFLTDSNSKSNDSDEYQAINVLRKSSGGRQQVRVPGLLENKVVLVTGGSRGVGRSTVRLLASHGASVAINYLKSDEQARMVKEIVEEDGGIADIFQADITDNRRLMSL
jgi:FlaA1/EpsC-like NDP-sugar epimerase